MPEEPKPMTPIDAVAYMVIRGPYILLEKRKLTKKVCPGATSIPGGHVEKGESIETALKREVQEELGIICEDYDFVCTLLHRSEEFRKLSYFVVNHWQGEIQNREAEALVWIPLDSLEELDLEVDRQAVREFIRVYGQSPA